MPNMNHVVYQVVLQSSHHQFGHAWHGRITHQSKKADMKIVAAETGGDTQKQMPL